MIELFVDGYKLLKQPGALKNLATLDLDDLKKIGHFFQTVRVGRADEAVNYVSLEALDGGSPLDPKAQEARRHPSALRPIDCRTRRGLRQAQEGQGRQMEQTWLL